MLKTEMTTENKNDPQYVLVLVSAQNCGACQQFYKYQYENLKTKVKSLAMIHEVKYPALQGPAPKGTPVGLQQYMGWFPMFILFTKSEWSLIEKGEKVNGRVMGGRFDADGRLSMFKDGYPYTADGVFKWVSDQIIANKGTASKFTTTFNTPSQETKTNLIPTGVAAEKRTCSVRYVPSKYRQTQ